MRRQGQKKLDAIILLAKASGGRRKHQSLVAILVLFTLFLVLGGLFVWWIWPAPKPGPLAMAVYDQVSLPDEPAPLCARLAANEPGAEGMKFSGREVHFQETRSGLSAKVATDRDGVACTEIRLRASEDPAEVLAGYPGNTKTLERGVQARGRVYVWPGDAAVLLVDADRGLSDTDESRFQTMNNIDIRPSPEALSALRALRTKFRIAYWSSAAQAPARYSKLRAWLERGWDPAQRFPDGPVLTNYRGDAGTVLTDMKRRFQGRLIGVTSQPEIAMAFQDSGLDTHLLTEQGEVRGGVTAVNSWPALLKALSP